MGTLYENGMTIAAAGTTAYISLGWIRDYAVDVFIAFAKMIVVPA